MKAAFYKGTRPGLAGIYNILVRWWTRSPYSHCELVFKDGQAASASFLDHGVRFKQISFDPDHWDMFDLPDRLEAKARAWFVIHDGDEYDLLGNAHFIIGPVGDEKAQWFCSEAIAAALGIPNPERYDPGTLASAIQVLNQPAEAGIFSTKGAKNDGS